MLHTGIIRVQTDVDLFSTAFWVSDSVDYNGKSTKGISRNFGNFKFSRSNKGKMIYLSKHTEAPQVNVLINRSRDTNIACAHDTFHISLYFWMKIAKKVKVKSIQFPKLQHSWIT